MAENRPMFDDEKLPKWLTEAGITHAGQTNPPTPLPPVPAPEIQPPPPELSQVAAPQPPAISKPASKPLKKLGSSPLGNPQPMPSAESMSSADPNLTYEEWERQHIEQEQEALRTPEDKLLDAVPDWLNATPDPALSASTSTGGTGGLDFVPAWFAGLEEQSPDDAPDWFKPDEIASTTLSGPISAKPSTAAESANAPDASLPDWLRGDVPSGSDVGGLNLDTLFAEPGAPEPTIPEPEIGGAPLSEALPTDEMALDWMSDLPDLPDFAAVEKPLDDPDFNPFPDQPVGESYDHTSDVFPTLTVDSAEEMPEWMRTLSPEERLGSGQAAPSSEMADLFGGVTGESSGTTPDWLSDLSGEPSSRPGMEAIPEASALPDWMADLQPNRSSAPTIQSPEADTARMAVERLDLSGTVSSDDIDALLSLPIPEHAAQSIPEPLVTSPTDFGSLSLDESDLDEILGPVQPSPDIPAAPEAVSVAPPVSSGSRRGRDRDRAPVDPNAPISKAQIPDALLERISTDEPVRFSVGPVQIAVQESSLAELSDQLRQLRERANAFKAPPASPAATAGPLADIAGTLAIEPIVIQAANTPSPSSIMTNVSDAQRQRVMLIRHILEMDAPPTADADASAKATPKTAARPANRIKVDRLVVTILLLLALVAPFFTNIFNVVAPPDGSKPTAEQSVVYRAIDSIKSGQPLLMAFEYGPTGANEMDDLALVLLRDLFKHGAKPIIVSTDFAGAMHADALLNRFGHDSTELQALGRTTDKPLVARQDYVVLRYLPSGASGVRSVINALYFGGFDSQTEFTTDVEGQPSGLNLANDLTAMRTAPVIVLAETPDDVRNWAEQYQTPASAPSGSTGTKIVLAVSAAAAATARTYGAALPKTVIGPLIGLRDATLYQLARQQPATSSALDRLNQRWQSVGFGALVAALLILFGALFSLLGALRRQMRNRRLGQAQAGGRR